MGQERRIKEPSKKQERNEAIARAQRLSRRLAQAEQHQEDKAKKGLGQLAERAERWLKQRHPREYERLYMASWLGESVRRRFPWAVIVQRTLELGGVDEAELSDDLEAMLHAARANWRLDDLAPAEAHRSLPEFRYARRDGVSFGSAELEAGELLRRARRASWD